MNLVSLMFPKFARELADRWMRTSETGHEPELGKSTAQTYLHLKSV